MTDREPFNVEFWQRRCDEFMKAVRENSADALMLAVITLDDTVGEALVIGGGEGIERALEAGARYFDAKFTDHGKPDDIVAVYDRH